jgi:hypothetical protein
VSLGGAVAEGAHAQIEPGLDFSHLVTPVVSFEEEYLNE